jgi:hypothetical protein
MQSYRRSKILGDAWISEKAISHYVGLKSSGISCAFYGNEIPICYDPLEGENLINRIDPACILPRRRHGIIG